MSLAMSCQFSGKLLPLPKIIVVIPDDDLIKILSEGQHMSNFAAAQSRILNYIMTQHQRDIASFKELLPAKSVRTLYP